MLIKMTVGKKLAFGLRQILHGLASPKIAHVKLPLAPSSITLLTANGPLGRAIDFGQRRLAECGSTILNISIFRKFHFFGCSRKWCFHRRHCKR
jgi:hypothetical protein